jgi:PilZ domain
MTISLINNKKVNINYTKILIKDIGPGGLCFISNIRLPISKNIILNFKMQFLEENISMFGHIAWSEKSADTLYEYGVEFILDEGQRCLLINLLNKFQIKIKKSPSSIDGPFISENPIRYFKNT